MPAPGTGKIAGVLHAFFPHAFIGSAAYALARLFAAAWAEDEAERERGRNALALIETYGLRHKSDCAFFCGNPCSCGLAPALEALSSEQAVESQTIPDHTDAAGNQWIGCTMDFSGGIGERDAQDAAAQQYVGEEELERENERQRLRREGYAEGAVAHAPQPGEPGAEFGVWWRGVRAAAAARYPFKKRTFATRDDPHNPRFKWRYIPEFNRFEWTLDGRWVPYRRSETTPITPERVLALAALLSDPWDVVDDHEIEDVRP